MSQLATMGAHTRLLIDTAVTCTEESFVTPSESKGKKTNKILNFQVNDYYLRNLQSDWEVQRVLICTVVYVESG